MVHHGYSTVDPFGAVQSPGAHVEHAGILLNVIPASAAFPPFDGKYMWPSPKMAASTSRCGLQAGVKVPETHSSLKSDGTVTPYMMQTQSSERTATPTQWLMESQKTPGWDEISGFRFLHFVKQQHRRLQ